MIPWKNGAQEVMVMKMRMMMVVEDEELRAGHSVIS